MLGPVDFSVPMPAYHSAPRSMMCGTFDSVSTLLMTVGLAYRPSTAGNGGRSRGWPALALERLEQRRLLAADVRARPRGAAPRRGRSRCRPRFRPGSPASYASAIGPLEDASPATRTPPGSR